MCSNYCCSILTRENHPVVFASPPLPAPESQPSAVLPMAPRAVSRNSDVMEGQRAGGSDGALYGCRSDAPGFTSAEKEPRWEHPAPSKSIFHEEHVRCYDDRRSERDEFSSGGFDNPGYGGRGNVHVESESPSRDDMFGAMAPCWRLLERAKGYMDKVCTSYGSTRIFKLLTLFLSYNLLSKRKTTSE